VRLEARGTIARSDSQRVFAFQSSNPWGTAVHDLAGALQEAVKPSPRLLAPSGEMDVVLAPAAAAVFWHEAVGHPLESDGGEQSSVLARVPGAVVGPPGLHVVDDPTRTDLPGRYLVDDEGIAAHTIPLIADGQIAGLLTDRRSAGADSNGHGRATDYRSPVRARMSNLVVPPGRVPLSELIARCGYGLYVKEVSSGTSDPESGRFLLSVENAEMIRRGRLGAPVSRFTLSGDVLSALGSMDPDLGDESRPASGLSICVKAGYPIPVGGAATALLLRGLQVRGTTR
jgi:TldD protein